MTFDPAWEALHESREWGRWPLEHLVRYVMRIPEQERRELDAIDLGCGAGAQTFFLATLVKSVLGVDGSESAIGRCIGRSWHHDDPVRFEVCDVCALPYTDGRFSLAVDVACLHHLPEREFELAMRSVYRVLRPGGRFFSYALRMGTSQVIIDRMPVRALSMHDVARLYSAHGFDITIDTAGHTDNGGQLDVKHWIISGIKK